MGFFKNLFSSTKKFFTETVPRATVGLGNKLQNAGRKVGAFQHLLGSGYNIARNIPLLGDFLREHPGIEHSIEAVGAAGNLLGELGQGHIGNAVNEGLRGVNEALGGGDALRDTIWNHARAPQPEQAATHWEQGVGGGLPTLVRNRMRPSAHRPIAPGPLIINQ